MSLRSSIACSRAGNGICETVSMRSSSTTWGRLGMARYKRNSLASLDDTGSAGSSRAPGAESRAAGARPSGSPLTGWASDGRPAGESIRHDGARCSVQSSVSTVVVMVAPPRMRTARRDQANAARQRWSLAGYHWSRRAARFRGFKPFEGIDWTPSILAPASCRAPARLVKGNSHVVGRQRSAIGNQGFGGWLVIGGSGLGWLHLVALCSATNRSLTQPICVVRFRYDSPAPRGRLASLYGWLFFAQPNASSEHGQQKHHLH